MKYVLTLILLLSSIACLAAIYLQKDKAGNIIYSDTPLTDNAQQINIPTTSSSPISQPSEPSVPVTTPKNDVSNKPYTTFLITSPADQETIQNQPVITVSFQIEPELQPGDKIQLYLDGKAMGKAEANTQASLDHIDRGTHQLYAVLLDSNEKVIKQSNSATIYVHYARVN